MIDKKGVLKNLKASLKIYETKKDAISHTKFLFDQYEKNEKKKKMLKLQKTQQIMEIDSEMEENIIDDFINTILEIHESIMGNKECSFNIQTVDRARRKTPVELTLRIYDDGSTKASISTTCPSITFKLASKKATKHNSTAIATALFKQYNDSVYLRTVTRRVSITCDKNGKLN